MSGSPVNPSADGAEAGYLQGGIHSQTADTPQAGYLQGGVESRTADALAIRPPSRIDWAVVNRTWFETRTLGTEIRGALALGLLNAQRRVENLVDSVVDVFSPGRGGPKTPPTPGL